MDSLWFDMRVVKVGEDEVVIAMMALVVVETW